MIGRTVLVFAGIFMLTACSLVMPPAQEERNLAPEELSMSRIFADLIQSNKNHLNGLGAIQVSDLMMNARREVSTRDPNEYVILAMDEAIQLIEGSSDSLVALWVGGARLGQCTFMSDLYYERLRGSITENEGLVARSFEKEEWLTKSNNCLRSLYLEFHDVDDFELRYFAIMAKNRIGINFFELKDRDNSIEAWISVMREFENTELPLLQTALQSPRGNLKIEYSVTGNIGLATKFWREQLIVTSKWPGKNRSSLLEKGMRNHLRYLVSLGKAAAAEQMFSKLCASVTGVTPSLKDEDQIISDLCEKYPWPINGAMIFEQVPR